MFLLTGVYQAWNHGHFVGKQGPLVNAVTIHLISPWVLVVIVCQYRCR